MADTKTSDETAATTPTGAELVRIVQGGSSKKTTLAVAGHQFRGARVKMNTDDTAVNAVAGYTIPFDAAVFDTDSFWSAGSPTRLTIPAGKGITHVVATAQVTWSASTADTFNTVAIRHYNSSDTQLHHIGQRQTETGSNAAALAVSTGPLAVSDGDYFTLLFVQETDTSVTVEGDQVIETFLALQVVGMEPV